jgi:putative addiction module component (TIGR02574 family)
MSITQIQKMSKTEQLQTMELLWDSLSHQSDLESPTWHKTVLDARRKKIASGKAKFYSLDEVKRRLLK